MASRTWHSGSPKRTLYSRRRGLPFSIISPANRTPWNGTPSLAMPSTVGCAITNNKKSITEASEKRHRSVTEASEKRHRSVTEASQKCHRSVTEVSQKCHRSVTEASQKRHRSVTLVSPARCPR
eukprot:6637212-Pyramimonas_sp.AAC.1